jgi:hypothetical protein
VNVAPGLTRKHQTRLKELAWVVQCNVSGPYQEHKGIVMYEFRNKLMCLSVEVTDSNNDRHYIVCLFANFTNP